jgi:hypothetical protein
MATQFEEVDQVVQPAELNAGDPDLVVIKGIFSSLIVYFMAMLVPMRDTVMDDITQNFMRGEMEGWLGAWGWLCIGAITLVTARYYFLYQRTVFASFLCFWVALYLMTDYSVWVWGFPLFLAGALFAFDLEWFGAAAVFSCMTAASGIINQYGGPHIPVFLRGMGVGCVGALITWPAGRYFRKVQEGGGKKVENTLPV